MMKIASIDATAVVMNPKNVDTMYVPSRSVLRLRSWLDVLLLNSQVWVGPY